MWAPPPITRYIPVKKPENLVKKPENLLKKPENKCLECEKSIEIIYKICSDCHEKNKMDIDIYDIFKKN